MKPSRFAAFLALFSIFFISPVPSNASGFSMKMNEAASKIVFQDSVITMPISAEGGSNCFSRALEVCFGLLVLVLFFSGLWIPLIVIALVIGAIFAAVKYIVTGEK